MQKRAFIYFLPLVLVSRTTGASPEQKPLAVRPGGLTAEQCVRRALEIAPSLDAARADIAEQEAATLNVMADYIPNVTLRAGYQRNSLAQIDFVGELPADLPAEIQQFVGLFSAFEQPLDNYSVQATLRAPLSEYAWQVMPALRAARSNEAAAQYRKGAQAVGVALSARLAYYSWLKASAQIGVARRAVKGAQARLADARQGLAAGTLAQVDVLRLEALLSAAELALSRARSAREIAEQDLALQIGSKGPFEVGEDLYRDAARIEPPVEQLIAHGRSERPDAKALLASMDAARDAGLRSWSQYFPRLEAVGSVNYANPNQLFFPPESKWRLNWFVALNLSWSVSRALRAHAEIKRFEAAEQALRAQLEQLHRAITLEVHTHWKRWKQASEALEVTAKQLAAAEAAYDQVQKRYAAGLSTTTDLIDAENTRQRAALDDIDARIDLRVAHARLLSGAGYAQLAEQTGAGTEAGSP